MQVAGIWSAEADARKRGGSVPRPPVARARTRLAAVTGTPALTLALAQRAPTWGDVTASVDRHAADVREAAGLGARLVAFPELSLTGTTARTSPPRSTTRCLRLAVVRPRRRAARPAARACAQTGAVALVGAPVTADGARLVATLLVCPDGSVTVHAKSHLHGAEHDLFPAVPPGEPFELDGWRVAVAICFDLATPSHAASAAAHDADLYVASVLYDVGNKRRFDLHGGARALDHRMVVAG